jgi:hypothetical protein
MVMTDGGRWKLWVHDRDSRESTFLSGKTLEEVFKSLDGVLRNGNGDWRPDREGGGGGGRKRA